MIAGPTCNNGTSLVSNRRDGVKVRFASPEIEQLLTHNGWDDLERLFGLIQDMRTRHNGRAVACIGVDDPHASAASAALQDQAVRFVNPFNRDERLPGMTNVDVIMDAPASTESLRADHPAAQRQRVFVKLNWGRRRLWPRMTDLRSGQLFQSLPEREWHGVGLLQSLGLAVQERLALLREGLWRFREAILVRAVPTALSWDDMIRNGDWQQLGRDKQDRLMEAAADVLQTIHAHGLGWRGTCTRHFFPQADSDIGWKMWLIDCEGVHARASSKTPARDAHKLIKALRHCGADTGTVLRMQRILATPARKAA